MLLELAIGDAYGAGFEYASDTVVRDHNTLAGYVRHKRHHNVPGTYTDDTQMSLAIAEAVVEDEVWTREGLAERFVAAFKRDPRPGYASGFYDFLCQVRDGTEFLERIRADSDKSGAAMRAAPIGVYPRLEEVLKRAALQAKLTHNTPDGVHAAQAAALAAHYCLYGLGPVSAMGQFIEQHVPGQWSVDWVGKVGPKGWMSVRAAITAVQRNRRLGDLLRDCIAFTGDVDTVATVALGAASVSSEYEADLPAALVDQLENGTYGRDYIIALDQRLMSRAGR